MTEDHTKISTLIKRVYYSAEAMRWMQPDRIEEYLRMMYKHEDVIRRAIYHLEKAIFEKEIKLFARDEDEL